MESTIYAIAIVLIFGAIIIFHEAGHFFAAKLSKTPVYEFAIGLGPVLASFVRRGTQYSIRAVPVGGFVRVAGMELGEEDVPDGFNSKSIGVRIAIIAAGVTMNVILAAIIFVLMYSVFGISSGATSVADRVIPGRPAAKAGMQAGDRIVAVNKIETQDVVKIRDQINANAGRTIPVVVERDGKRVNLTVVPERKVIPEAEVKDGKVAKIYKKAVGQVGIVFRPAKVTHLTFGESLKRGLTETYYTLASIWESLLMVIQRKAPADVAGPVGIVKVMYEEAQVSWLNFIRFAGIFNVMIAFFNLIPFPALDGSRIMFLVFEAILGRRIDPRKEELAHKVGLIVLLAFVLLVTVGDVWKLIRPE